MEIFVSSPFSPDFEEVFQAIESAGREGGIEAYRVDKDHVAKPIAETIARKIRECHIVVADISGNNPNVLNEIGQAQSLGKPLIIISQDSPTNAPFNIRGLRIIKYNPDNLPSLHEILKQALSEATSPNEVLRSMLVPGSLGRPGKDSRFVIAASPLAYRRAMRRVGGHRKLRRTSSDYVGLRSILQAFGLLYGFEALPDIIDPDDFEDGVIAEPMNIYCIASPKTNRWTGELLKRYHSRWVPRLEFRADPWSKNLKDIRISLFSDNAPLAPPGWMLGAEENRGERDFGLVLRAPNPFDDKNMVAIIAGRGALGTEAACRAFTDVNIIREIRDLLRGRRADIENHRHAFWALASMNRATEDGKGESILESLRLHQVDMLRPI